MEAAVAEKQASIDAVSNEVAGIVKPSSKNTAIPALVSKSAELKIPPTLSNIGMTLPTL